MAATPVTRASLKTRCLQRGNTSGYVDPSVGGELSQLVDTSLGKMHNLLAAELYQDYFLRRHTFALTANQMTYALPADFLKMRGAWFLTPSTTAPNDLSQASGAELRALDANQEFEAWGNSSPSGIPYGFIQEDRSILIVPAPASTANYIGLRYIPRYVPAESDDTPIDFAFAFGWDEWVVNDVVFQIRVKAGMPLGEIERERDKFEERIRRQAVNRNVTQPPRVRRNGWTRGGGSPWGNFSFQR